MLRRCRIWELRASSSLSLSAEKFVAFLSSQAVPAQELESVPLTVAAFQIWGANTGVGKSLISAGLLKKASEASNALYLKPVQTGFPEDSDARLVGAACRIRPSVAQHAARLAGCEASKLDYQQSIAHTDFAWQQPVSPHFAVAHEGRGIDDDTLRRATLAHLNAFAAEQSPSESKDPAIALVETAGGPASPAPSGKLQCDAWRPLRLPALLVGDGALGGISATLTAAEALTRRGFDLAAVAVQQGAAPGGSNAAAIADHLGRGADGPAVFELPTCAPPAGRTAGETGEVDDALRDWLEASEPKIAELLQHLRAWHARRLERLQRLAGDTLESVWYPFTQHQGLIASAITVVDARAGDSMLVATPEKIEPNFDACASWWTQGVNDDLHPLLVGETMRGVSRYGHVMHPNVAIEPTLQLARTLLGLVGRGWASRVFYSDDGSTAIEVALKMAFRKFWADHSDVDVGGAHGPPAELRVIGIDGGYHGDTLGAMDAVAPSPYNGPAQFPWYKGRGLFLEAPRIGLRDGVWRLLASDRHGAEETWASLEEAADHSRNDSATARRYDEGIHRAMDDFEGQATTSGASQRLAACILEPLVQGAGGMAVVDPLFQRRLVAAARERRIPVIFDEVFTGLWRLGAPSAAELLGLQPDIACYAKLLTGGLLPLSVTLASPAVFDAFSGDSKLDALLHGHSYSGHAAGASAAIAALRIFSSPSLNPALAPGGRRLRQLWPAALVEELSRSPRVDSVVAIGTVLAAELKTGDGSGYASGASAAVVSKLRARGIFARPLGSVVYLMVTPTTRAPKAASLLRALLDALQDA